MSSYKRDVPANYQLPRAYIRYQRYPRTQEEWDETVEYVADNEDEEWLKKNTKFGAAAAVAAEATAAAAASTTASGSTTNSKSEGDAKPDAINGNQAKAKKQRASLSSKEDAIQHRRQQLSLSMFERMLDLLEKTTAFEAIITNSQAENLILSRMPQMFHMWPSKGRQGIITTKTVIHDVYNYWVQKRSKLKRPLLRRFWPVTSTDDTNPHLVFRPREKEKYKLRKKRQNDMDAYLKLKQLRSDFDNLRAVLDLVRHREELGRTHLRLQVDLFQQRLYDIVDTSGLPRHSSKASSRDEVKRLTESIPIHFDVHHSTRRAKRVRTSHDNSTVHSSSFSATGSGRMSPTVTSATGTGSALQQNRDMLGSTMGDAGLAFSTKMDPAVRQSLVVAGHNHGEPTPLFLHPLKTRESYATSWDGSDGANAPNLPTYADSRMENTFRFRHRARVGRGGRVCVDRIPTNHQPTTVSNETEKDEHSKATAIETIFIAGQRLPQSLQAKERLLDLLPRPLDKTSISRKIELISVAAVKEDAEAAKKSARSGGAVHAGVHGEADAEENDGDEVIVRLDEWLQTDDQLWGEERFAIGPI